MSTVLEIERKFLVEFPDLKLINVKRKISIVQTYLNSDNSQIQRRIRKININGSVNYTYTEKTFLTPITRKETEYIINEDEYKQLIKQSDQDCAPVQKVRYVFEYKHQSFELDTYPFSDKLAILELELSEPDQKIFFPDCLNIIKDVSDDHRYSNAALANAGTFPK